MSDSEQFLFEYLSQLLSDLEFIEQPPQYHPEGNALYHSLQVYQLARAATNDPQLWAAALLHDVGKATASRGHASIGREMLHGLLSPRVCWLVEHHLHLLTAPHRTRNRLRGSKALHDLEQLREWDLGGRQTDCNVPSVDEALASLFLSHSTITATDSDEIYSRSISINS